MRFEIEQVLADPSGASAQPVVEVVPAAPQSKLPWVAAIALAAITASSVVWFLTLSGPQQPVRLTAVHPGTDVSWEPE